MGDKKRAKSADKYVCEMCDFHCSKKFDWERHKMTLKHKMVTEWLQNGDILAPKSATPFICECGKKYNHRQGLSRHKKQCIIEEKEKEEFKEETNELQEMKEFMKYLMKENTEMKSMMVKVIENGTNNTTNNNNIITNSHNKSFNLNFFLNETCKDAMNITDFLDSIKVQLSDLEKVGELGYVEGISNIIVKNLKELDVTQRPVHCTDKKRETIYIKDENKWEKDEEKDKMHKIVRKIADKNARMLPKFKEAHPDCNKAASKYSDAYNKIIVESMGGSGDNNFEKEEKIIKKVAKEVMVEKEPTGL